MRNMVAVSTCLISVFAVLFFTNYGYTEIDLNTAVGIWLFEEGSGTTAADSSSNGADGTLQGGAAWTSGKYGGAIDFNGTDACVQTGQKLLDGITDFTIVAWVQPGDITSNRVGLVGQNDSPEFGFIDPTTVNLWTPTAGGLANTYNHPAGEWHHVAAVASATFTRVYIDGVAEEQTGDYAAGHGSSAFDVNIGGCGVWDDAGNWFTGAMDDVAIFHAVLEDADVQAIMDDGLASALGMTTAVEPAGKLAVSWGAIKYAK